jgi:hypothetical protein
MNLVKKIDPELRHWTDSPRPSRQVEILRWPQVVLHAHSPQPQLLPEYGEFVNI